MKKIITRITAVVAPVIAAIALAPAGHALPTSSKFCDAIEIGLADGLSYKQIIAIAGNAAAESGIDPYTGGRILAASVQQYCPEYMPGLVRAAASMS